MKKDKKYWAHNITTKGYYKNFFTDVNIAADFVNEANRYKGGHWKILDNDQHNESLDIKVLDVTYWPIKSRKRKLPIGGIVHE